MSSLIYKALSCSGKSEGLAFSLPFKGASPQKSGARLRNNCGTRLTSPLIVRRGEVKIGRVYLLFFFFKERKYESQFFASLFVWRYKENGRRGGSAGKKKKITREETNSAHTHTQTHMHKHTVKKKKKQGTSLTYECHMQMVGREQMLLHLIDLYANCIQTFQCVFWAHCLQFPLASH